MAKTKVRLFGQLGAQFDNLQKAIDLDSASLINIATDAGIDSAEAIALIDSSYVGVRSSLSYTDISSKPTTLSGYGITDADSDQQVDSDRNAVISDLRNSVSSSFDTLQEIAASINNDSDFSTTIDNVFYRKTYQGLNYGYYAGGSPWPQAYAQAEGGVGTIGGNDAIRKYSFGSSASLIDVGDLTVGRVKGNAGGHSSEDYGYTSGGTRAYTDPSNPFAPYSETISDGVDAIDKFAFTSDGNATDVGDLAEDRAGHSSHSSKWNAKGYLTGGNAAAPPYNISNAPATTTIQSFPFASDAGSTVSTGTLNQGRGYWSDPRGGNSSNSHGYTLGGTSPSNMPGPSGYYWLSTLEKFPFAIDEGGSQVGSGNTFHYSSFSSSSSQTHGYAAGIVGHPFTPTPMPAPQVQTLTNRIEKFPFSSDAQMSDVGDLAFNQAGGSGNSSTTHGFHVMGRVPIGAPSPGTQYKVQKYSFASDANAVDHFDFSGTGTDLENMGHGQNY